MKIARKAVLSLAALWATAALPALAAAKPVPFKLMTANCYAFDETLAKTLKDVTWLGSKLGFSDKPIDLQSGIQKNTGTRRREISQQVIASGADVACFQELWNADNKIDMINLLSKKYKYYYITSKIKNGKTEMDDGLLMVSKWPPFFTYSEEFKDRYDEEKRAHKGFLMMGLNIPGGGFLLVIGTHIQSGTDDTACQVRDKQLTQMVNAVNGLKKTDWRIQNAKVLVAGDLNEPITIDGNLMFDRSRCLVDRFNELGWPVNSDQTLAILTKKYKTAEVYHGNQVQRKGLIRAVNQAIPVNKWSNRAIPADNSSIARFNGDKANWPYFVEASEPSGRQLLDHAFLDPSVATLEKFTVYRKEFLGDKMDGGQNTYDAYTAISDHAGVLFTLKLQPYNP
jgi:endonuclease/exonuclease/phosphatase family metal-dependent hydrolase